MAAVAQSSSPRCSDRSCSDVLASTSASVQTGTSHGGVVLPDGSIVISVGDNTDPEAIPTAPGGPLEVGLVARPLPLVRARMRSPRWTPAWKARVREFTRENAALRRAFEKQQSLIGNLH